MAFFVFPPHVSLSVGGAVPCFDASGNGQHCVLFFCGSFLLNCRHLVRVFARAIIAEAFRLPNTCLARRSITTDGG